jgi:hypothetical protein
VCVLNANERESGKVVSNKREGIWKKIIPWEYIFSLLLTELKSTAMVADISKP